MVQTIQLLLRSNMQYSLFYFPSLFHHFSLRQNVLIWLLVPYTNKIIRFDFSQL